ncbi:hypothetical protein DL93DRAFT_2162480 [Clavulina sp. PMI_390]|nr:hypothetical protein DL93DRAFT_2162480 [Clavulina sp. PMI_390]
MPPIQANPISPRSQYPRNASIVLIGMRGVGKRSLASLTAKALGWDALFADQIFADLAKQDVLSYVKMHGWDDFRAKEAQIIAWLLSHHPTNKVIACGGGVVEREDSRRLLREFGRTKGPVIHVMREKDKVLSFLESNANVYPSYNRSTAGERWDAREEFYFECSSHEFFALSVDMPPRSRSQSSSSSSTPTSNVPLNPKPSSSGEPSSSSSHGGLSELTTLALKPVEASFLRLLRFIVGLSTNHLPLTPSPTYLPSVSTLPNPPRSYMLSLTFADVSQALPLLDEISIGLDCWEIRVDWLRSVHHTFIAQQIALLRRYSELPIRLTTRTVGQGGRFPDFQIPPRTTHPYHNQPHTFDEVTIDAQRQRQLFDLVVLAFKLGCEYVDIELTWPIAMLQALISHPLRGHTHIIASYHDTIGRPWTGREMREMYERGMQLGVDLVELIGTARVSEDNIALRTFKESIGAVGGLSGVAPGGRIPLIAFNMGPEGKLSRISNQTLTALSHPALPSVAAPGQISYAETQSTLYLIGSLPAQTYYLFGSPIGHSLSPLLHRTAFRALSLPHTFTSITLGFGYSHPSNPHINEAGGGGAVGNEAEDMERLREVVSRPDFGGAAVTIPLKVPAVNLCSRVSHHARVIGAVNTLIPINTPGLPPSMSRSNSNPGLGGSANSSGQGSSMRPLPGLYGENTDWRGIKTCIERRITPVNAPTARTTALVLGAGGTSRAAIYALHQLGVANILVWNRSLDKAEKLVEELGRRIRDVEGDGFLRLGVLRGGLDAENVRRAFEPLAPPTIIISTIPASVHLPPQPSGPMDVEGYDQRNRDYDRIGTIPDIGLRRELLDLSPAGGVAVELAYQPRMTPLLALVEQVNAFPMPLMGSRPASPGAIVASNAPVPSSSSTRLPVKHSRTSSPPKVPSPPPHSTSSPTTPPKSDSNAHMMRILGGKTSAPWLAVEGVEILLEQGYEQVRLWTARRAPQAPIRREVIREFERRVREGFA